jgi:hypothetical protein
MLFYVCIIRKRKGGATLPKTVTALHPKAGTPIVPCPRDRKRGMTMGSIGYIVGKPTGAATAPQKGTGKGATIDRVELLLDGKKDARSLASELESGLCFASECVENLLTLSGQGVLGSLCVLHTYLEYLNTMAAELYGIIPAGGDAL